MRNDTGVNPYEKVALHPEGVDRNKMDAVRVAVALGRPPPGGRG